MSDQMDRGGGGAPSQNKYKKLISNTLLFGVSTFGSKVLVVFLTRLYTELLPTDEFGLADLIMNTANMILPVMYLCIAESVIRFALDDHYKRTDLFSVGVATVLIGYGGLWLLYPLLQKAVGTFGMADYMWLIYLYCLTSAMRTVITNYVRATGLVRVYAIDGILTTASTIAFNLIFLMGFKMGVVGFVLGTVVADGLSALSLFLFLRLHRFLKFRGIDKDTIVDMLRYAIPLIPTAVAWWVTTNSDKFFIERMVGVEETGIYSAAQRIPNLIMQVSTFFTRAWELSAFSEYDSGERDRFFTNVFRSYSTFVFLLASGLLLFIKPFTSLLVAADYREAWRYSVFLILAVSFSCLVTFLGAVYNAVRKNVMVSVTTVIGAVLNIALNALLIPKYHAVGAAFATFASFFLVFLIRAVDTRRYIRIDMRPLRMALHVALLLAQAFIGLYEVPLWVLWEVLIFAALVLMNFGYIIIIARKGLGFLGIRRRPR